MSENISLVGASCCGCMACEAVCPVHAIELDTRGGIGTRKLMLVFTVVSAWMFVRY